MTETSARQKYLEDTLTLQLGELYSIGEAHPDYHVIKERITVYAKEFYDLTGRYFTISYPIHKNRSRKE